MSRRAAPDNAWLASTLRELALYLEMDGVPFKPQAMQRAAAAVVAHPAPLSVLHAEGGREALEELPGVGKGIAHRLVQLLESGHVPDLDAYRARWPVDVRALIQVEGLGPKSVRALHERLGVRTLEDLAQAVDEQRVREVPGFGARSEERLRTTLGALSETAGRRLLGSVLATARALESSARALRGVCEAEVAGSFRRFRETVGDLDLVVASTAPAQAVRGLSGLPGISQVVASGPTKLALRLQDGLRVDVRVVRPASWGAALLYFTGSKAHNVALRTFARGQGLKLSEYGLFRGRTRVAGRTEEEIFHALGLAWIPPELRENAGEIGLAQLGALPKLLERGDVRGDLQVHTAWTDGKAGIAEMARAAARLGREYLVITDHARDLAFLGGLDEPRLRAEVAEIRTVDRGLHGIRVLAGAEVNVRRDGTLDLDDRALAGLDVCGVAVHAHFDLPRAQQTERLLRAVRHPWVDILFHPTARSLGRRRGLDVDWGAVMAACRESGTVLELDARPDRLDLPRELLRDAVHAGVRLCVDSDAHGPGELRFLDDLGVGSARRGGVPRDSVVNALPVGAFLGTIKRARTRKGTH